MITYICDVCDQAITSTHPGYLASDDQEVYDAQTSHAEFEAKHTTRTGLLVLSGGDLMDWPTPARWRVLHAACDPQPDAGAYCIHTDRADSHEKLLAWSAHLMGKPWLKYTDWDELIGRHAPKGVV